MMPPNGRSPWSKICADPLLQPAHPCLRRRGNVLCIALSCLCHFPALQMTESGEFGASLARQTLFWQTAGQPSARRKFKKMGAVSEGNRK
jgi:hypothetical protein